MSVKYAIYLRIPNAVVNLFLICVFNFSYIEYLSLFNLLPELFKDPCFLVRAYVPSVSAIVCFGYCLQALFKIQLDQVTNMRSVIPRFFRYFFLTNSIAVQFRHLKTLFYLLISAASTCGFYFFFLFFIELVFHFLLYHFFADLSTFYLNLV